MTDEIWSGLSREDVRALTHLYADAELELTRRPWPRARNARQVAADEIVHARRNLRTALADELRERGCPEGVIVESAAAIVLLALRSRRASPGDGALHAAE